ncbi:trichome birefringence-like [Striga asiatica]|uniref:Trichome birefringence-like n=1 Tax=Striga asiatica TaxID=4170 RepID=A0A5A7QHF7_STRAF|nr:trichome birefringence-like [Striga asiatica]
MANREFHYSSRKLILPTLSLASRLLLSLLCLASIVLCFSLFRNDTASPPPLTYSVVPEKNGGTCDYSDGRWIYDPTVRSPPRYDHTCKEIFKGWNCIASGKSNAVDILKWRWKPYGCDLPPFDALRFLEKSRDTNIGFIGDSLNRNMFVSLFCALKQVCPEVKKWRPAGADRGFTFVKYNLTIAYHRTNLLARYGRWSANSNGGTLESLGYKEGYRVDVDLPEGTWAEAPSFHDILVFNTGHWCQSAPDVLIMYLLLEAENPCVICELSQVDSSSLDFKFLSQLHQWWAPSKFDPVKSPMLFFEKGLPVTPPVAPEAGLDMVLKHMVEQLFSIKNNGTNVETRLVNQHLYRALEGSNFQILDITRMSEFRADAHPSTAGGKRHDDCMHWCLPGLTDTWNDLFIAQLNTL